MLLWRTTRAKQAFHCNNPTWLSILLSLTSPQSTIMSQSDVATMLLAAFASLLAQLVSQPTQQAAPPGSQQSSLEPLLAALNVLRGPVVDQRDATPDSDTSARPADPPQSPAPAASESADDVPDGTGTSIFVAHPQGDIGGITGFACARCHTYNLFQDSRKTWYCVTVGKRVGVYRGYNRVHSWVNGFPSNVFTKHRTLKEALRTWADAYYNDAIQFPPLHVRDCTLPDPDFFGEATVPPYTGEVEEPAYHTPESDEDA
ncbi:hypothetical protein CC2G_014449 [Coprinopsis cinerea AmutBmut pab1-1]|nr:hypothetical protein CC2G_014449 [Coprinopsis cinerea AmutBmut pab1-1]